MKWQEMPDICEAELCDSLEEPLEEEGDREGKKAKERRCRRDPTDDGGRRYRKVE
jgi:hypothetical protein